MPFMCTYNNRKGRVGGKGRPVKIITYSSVKTVVLGSTEISHPCTHTVSQRSVKKIERKLIALTDEITIHTYILWWINHYVAKFERDGSLLNAQISMLTSDIRLMFTTWWQMKAYSLLNYFRFNNLFEPFLRFVPPLNNNNNNNNYRFIYKYSILY